MSKYLAVISVFTLLFLINLLNSEPSFNGSTPGCGGGGCHSFTSGLVNVTSNALEVEVSLSSVAAGEKVGGELVNSAGTVVTSINNTSNNPFKLTAPEPGLYTVNAGFKKPSRQWDSVSVEITVSDIDLEGVSKFPTKLELFKNHPNPFNNETLIRFSLPGPAFTKVQIYDLQGRLVRTLMKGDLQQGLHQVRWNGEDDYGSIVASGIYIYNLQHGETRIAKRLTLVK